MNLCFQYVRLIFLVSKELSELEDNRMCTLLTPSWFGFVSNVLCDAPVPYRLHDLLILTVNKCIVINQVDDTY